MNYSQKFLQKLCILLSYFSLFFQSFYPYLVLAPVALAQEKTEASLEFKTESHEFVLKVNTTEEVRYKLVYRNDNQDEEIVGESEVATDNFERHFYAGTCSENGTCTPNSVLRGILKLEVKAENYQTTKKFIWENNNIRIIEEEEEIAQFDLTTEEKLWLETGLVATPSATPIPTITQETLTPTLTPTLGLSVSGKILDEGLSIERGEVEGNQCIANSLSSSVVSDKVTICHADNANTKPYGPKAIEVDKNGTAGGHDDHTGPVWYAGISVDWGDIIPPYTYYENECHQECAWKIVGWRLRYICEEVCEDVPKEFSGLNWTTAGQEIYNNDCQIPEPTGSITIHKSTDPDWIHSLKFDFQGTLGNFDLHDDESQSFEEQTLGAYTIVESDQLGWKLTDISCTGANDYRVNLEDRSVTVNLEAGELVDCTFTNTKTRSIEGYKWNDENSNGIRDIRAIWRWPFWEYTEDKLSGWTITADKNRDGVIEASTLTDSNGNYELSNLLPGEYDICEVQQPGWTNTYPNSSLCQVVTLSRWVNEVGVKFGNKELPKTGSISGYKFADNNGNGTDDSDDSALKDWAINIYRDGEDTPFNSTYTDQDGNYSFNELTAGKYFLCEASQPGWIQTYPSSGEQKTEQTYCHEVDLTSGETITGLSFGNKPNPVKIKAQKVICDYEADLPNWGNHGSSIGANTAQDWVNSHPNCRLEEQWTFQWAKAGGGSYGTFQTATGEYSSPWTTFSANETVEIMDLSSIGSQIEMREVFPSNYGPLVPFSNDGDYSSEFYCSGDVYQYDNWEWISNPQYGQIYYCVGFNALAKGDLEITKKVNWSNLPEDTAKTFEICIHSDVIHPPSCKTIGSNGGTLTWEGLLPGNYEVFETNPGSAWEIEGANNSTIVTVGDGGKTTHTVTNRLKTATLIVRKNVDLNADGDYTDDGEANVGNWTWDITNSEQNIQTGQSRALPLGTYNIKEDQKSDYVLENWSCANRLSGRTNSIDLSLSAEEEITCTFNNRRKTAALTICKIILDASGRVVTGSDLSNVNFTLGDRSQPTPSTGAAVGQFPTLVIDSPLVFNANLLSNVAGNDAQCFRYNNLLTGNYYFGEETLPSNIWKAPLYRDSFSGTVSDFSSFSPYSGELFDSNPSNDGARNTTADGHIVLNANRTMVIVNQYQAGSVLGTKYEDVNQNHLRDLEPVTELGLKGWTIELREIETGAVLQSAITDDNGNYGFYKLIPGDYRVCEINQRGWTVSDPDLGVVTEGCKRVTVGAGEELEANFGNFFIEPSLRISKFNNKWPNDQLPGNAVDYTLQLEVLDNNVNDVVVTDLLPAGFKYREGSYRVYKNGAPYDIPAPEYHSPGKYFLSDLVAGDKIEIIYTADISSETDLGIYRDIAFAYGCNDLNQDESCSVTDEAVVLAQANDSGKADSGVLTDNFVGTKVNLNKETHDTVSYNVEKTEKQEGSVLGASTSRLPATGASSPLTQLLFILFSGSIISLLGQFFMKNKRVLLAVLSSCFILVYLARDVRAGGYLNIQVEQPKSPTNTNSFQLDFVAIDMTGKAIVVDCYQKKSSAATYTLFQTVSLKEGGNSGACSVTSSILNENGVYQFYAKAKTDSESANSELVTVDYNTNAPSTPDGYRKDHPTNCEYKLTIHTGNDNNKTTKIEIYRSDKTEFTADSGTKISTLAAGSNVEVVFNDTVPDCGKAYYYVVRAFDNHGNGSGLIGDANIRVTLSSSTPTTSSEAQESQGAVLVEDANLPSESVSEEGTVLGKQITRNQADKLSEGKVLGTKKEASLWSKIKAYPLLGLITFLSLTIVLYVISRYFHKKGIKN